MTFVEMQECIKKVLQSLDRLSCNGSMTVKGLAATQELAGCSVILQQIAELESLDGEEKTGA